MIELQNSKISRNIQKFKFKYGFDPQLYVDGEALGLNRDELVELLGIHHCVLDNFLIAQHVREKRK